MVGADVIKPLHGLRGIAAMTVVVGHLAPVRTAPALGVVLFFVLSGFLIGKLYVEQSFSAANIWRYVVARIARVYPLFAAVILGTAILNGVTDADVFRLRPDQVVQHLLLAGGASTVWTISAEFQFYGLFILIWALRSHLSSALTAIIPLLLIAASAMLWLGVEASRINIFGYLHIFILGVATASLTSKDDGRFQRVATWLLPLLALGYLVAFIGIPRLYPPRWIYMDLIVVAMCAALLACAIIGRNCLANRILSLPMFLWLGEVSFGVYLLHRHAQWAVDAVAGDISHWLTLPVKILLALALAQFANWAIERPCRAFLRRIGGRILPSATL